MSKIVKVGIIGCGFIANSKHLPSLNRQRDRVEIVGLCDLEIEKAEKAKAKYQLDSAELYTDYKEMIARDDIDVIQVCTPNVTHCELTCNALKAGKHVMCEKPMAITAEEAQKMIDTAKECGKKLTIGYQNRFRDDVTFVKNAIDEGQLGEIYYGKAHAIRRRGVPTWGVFTDKSKQGGGPLIDIGTHALDITLWYMDNYEVESVTGNCFFKLGNYKKATYGNNGGAWDTETFEVEDSAVGFVKMKNGAVITLEAAWALNTLDEGEAICSVSGTEGGAQLFENYGYGHRFQSKLNATIGKRLVEITPTPQSGIAFSDDGDVDDDVLAGITESVQWIDAIINDTEPLVKPEQAKVVTQILEAIYKSNATGKEVFFD